MIYTNFLRCFLLLAMKLCFWSLVCSGILAIGRNSHGDLAGVLLRTFVRAFEHDSVLDSYIVNLYHSRCYRDLLVHAMLSALDSSFSLRR